jgi:hypothetical protein
VRRLWPKQGMIDQSGDGDVGEFHYKCCRMIEFAADFKDNS